MRNLKEIAKELAAAKREYDLASNKLKALKEELEKASPSGYIGEEFGMRLIAEHTTSSYDWKKLEAAMELDETLAAIGKMFIKTTPVKASYTFHFYKK